MLQQCYNNVTTMLQQCYDNVTTMLQQCYNNVTTMLQQCHDKVTTKPIRSGLLVAAVRDSGRVLYIISMSLRVRVRHVGRQYELRCPTRAAARAALRALRDCSSAAELRRTTKREPCRGQVLAMKDTNIMQSGSLVGGRCCPSETPTSSRAGALSGAGVGHE